MEKNLNNSLNINLKTLSDDDKTFKQLQKLQALLKKESGLKKIYKK